MPSANPRLGLALTDRTISASGAVGAQGSLDATAVPFNIRDYGAKGDGVTDDTLAIQQAVNDAAASGGGRVILPALTGTTAVYVVKIAGTAGGQTYCVRVPSNVHIDISPGATVKYAGTAGGVMFYCLGATTSAQTLATANVALGATVFPVTSAAGLTIGQDCQIGDTLNFETNRITNIVGLNVTLENPTQFAYTTANNAFLQGYTLVSNVKVSGGGTIDGNNLSSNCVQFADTKLCTCEGLELMNTATDNVTFFGRGVLFSGVSTRGLCRGNYIHNTADRGIEDYVYTSFINVVDNVVMVAAIHGIAVHGRAQQIIGNRVIGGCATGQAYASIHLDTAFYTRVIGNVCVASKARGIQMAGGNGAFVLFADNVVEGAADNALYVDTANDVTLVNNIVQNNAGLGIYLTTVNRAQVVGNLSRGNGSDGFRFNTGDDIVLTGNTFTGNSAFGIRFSTTPTKAFVFNNTLTGNVSGMSSGTYNKFTLTDAATILVDCANGSQQVVTLGGNRTMGAPSNVQPGFIIWFTIIQDGTGGRTLAWNAVYKQVWSDTGNTLNKRSTIGFIYDGTNWNQLAAQSPYA